MPTMVVDLQNEDYFFETYQTLIDSESREPSGLKKLCDLR
jgi:hypothetical protein